MLKARSIVSFFARTRTPLALAIDALKLNKHPIAAVTRDGIKLRLEPSSRESFTFYENLIRRDYLANGITLRPGDTVIDIGANIGSFTVLGAKVVGPDGRVISFEPVAQTFARLEENVALNGYHNVECRCAAIDAKEGMLAIRVDHKSALSTAYLEGGERTSGAVHTAPCLMPDGVFCEHNLDRINLLTVDCEGSEYGTFESLSPSVAARIGQIAMAVHFWVFHDRLWDGKSPTNRGAFWRPVALMGGSQTLLAKPGAEIATAQALSLPSFAAAHRIGPLAPRTAALDAAGPVARRCPSASAAQPARSKSSADPAHLEEPR